MRTQFFHTGRLPLYLTQDPFCPSILCVCWGRRTHSICLPGRPITPYTAQAELEYTVILLPHPKYWDWSFKFLPSFLPCLAPAFWMIQIPYVTLISSSFSTKAVELFMSYHRAIKASNRRSGSEAAEEAGTKKGLQQPPTLKILSRSVSVDRDLLMPLD